VENCIIIFINKYRWCTAESYTTILKSSLLSGSLLSHTLELSNQYLVIINFIIGRKPQVVSAFNASPAGKTLWRNFAFVFQRQSWAWQFFILGLTFAFYHIVRDPLLLIYEANNTHRGYNAAITREKAHKKKIQDQEEAEAQAEE